MADTETTHMKFVDQTSGGNNNSWGTITDENWARADAKFGSTTSVSTTGGTTALSETQERVAVVDVSGTLVSNATIIFSGRGGFWIVRNQTSGAFTVTAKVSGQTGVVIMQGTATLVWCNGTDIVSGVASNDLVNDTSPQLGADLDANGFSIQFDDATGIEDDSGNEQVRFQKTAAAVNQIDVTNAATGGSPRLDATGDDTNIDLTLAGKGTGGIVAGFKNATGLGIKDSDASHELKVTTSSNLTANRTLTLVPGDADRSLTLAGDLNVSGAATVSGTHAGTSSGTNTGDEPTASTSAEGVIEIATAAEVKTGTDTARAVTPGDQQQHKSAVKAHGRVSSAGALQTGSYGVTTAIRSSTGVYLITLAAAMADTNYTVVTGTLEAAGSSWLPVNTSPTQITVSSRDDEDNGLIDRGFSFMVMGDLA